MVASRFTQAIAALAFLAMGVLMGREAVRAANSVSDGDRCETYGGRDASSQATCSGNWTAFRSTVSLLFFAELGDKTQLAVVSMAGQSGSAWPVFVGGTLALIAVTALGVVGGQWITKVVPDRLVPWIAAGIFAATGAWIGFSLL
jgi:putative Ca2+/H+ antiporter (TMEM165/GDT1 family)